MSRRAAVSARYSLGTISRRAVNFHFYREARGVARARWPEEERQRKPRTRSSSSPAMSIWKCDIPMVIPGRFGVCPLLTRASVLSRDSPLVPPRPPPLCHRRRGDTLGPGRGDGRGGGDGDVVDGAGGKTPLVRNSGSSLSPRQPPPISIPALQNNI